LAYLPARRPCSDLPSGGAVVSKGAQAHPMCPPMTPPASGPSSTPPVSYFPHRSHRRYRLPSSSLLYECHLWPRTRQTKRFSTSGHLHAETPRPPSVNPRGHPAQPNGLPFSVKAGPALTCRTKSVACAVLFPDLAVRRPRPELSGGGAVGGNLPHVSTHRPTESRRPVHGIGGPGTVMPATPSTMVARPERSDDASAALRLPDIDAMAPLPPTPRIEAERRRAFHARVDATPAQVRRRARENGHDVHAHGLMPWSVLRAFETARSQPTLTGGAS
jgi:hypothetical protein